MPILSTSEVKTLLQISVSTYDTLIGILLPIVEEAIINHCNNHFIDTYEGILGTTPTVYVYGNTFEFINSDNSVNNTDKDFTAMDFQVDDNVRVYNSLQNNKVFKIATIAATKITFDTDITIKDEDNDNTVIIGRVLYPEPIKLVAADMVGYKLQKRGKYFKSEKIDDYSYTRDEKLVNGYPQSIMSQLDDYSSVYLKQIPMNLLYYRQD